MSDEIKKYLDDIFKAIQLIEGYVGEEKKFENFLSNKMMQQAIERNLEIIGEAAKNILQLQNDIEITAGRKIVNIRNLLIHAYDNVDSTRIWEIIIIHLPVLKSEVSLLLKR